ncbi:hydantoinase/oxoprolinase family protein [Bradyrhizobium sp. LTSP885]|uniref:hydantoinase/oxoprolinase family protein n=1 Tax=Bradyrhizobium sp. LTSP885 TaxID=1619232 RepID=UPI0018CFD905|nr:hydantoinase/oxoprolinase family protein [Bradyrhizobium sp. LTSP885]
MRRLDRVDNADGHAHQLLPHAVGSRSMNASTKPVRIGVDIGGTFTDLQIFDARDGRIVAYKLPTTPEDPSIALVEGIKTAGRRYGFTLSDVGYLMHGTTIATNAVLERKLPAGALVTTAGFEDVLEIGRHYRREVYSIHPQPVPALIPRNRRFGFHERMRFDGTAERVPTEADIDAVITQLAAVDIETVAVALLHAYANSDHEQRLADRIRKALPRLDISLSSVISPEIREYERTSTTVLNALLQPVVRAYIERLGARMRAEAFAPHLLIVQSNGGVCTPATAAAEPARLLLSGPSGGAMAALELARQFDEPNLVAVDMGGTSFDVSVVRDNRLEIVTLSEIDRLPVRLPMIEIRTIGAGGGSIARVNAARQMTVGPESAGARPGPVCYSRGGTEPTVTDANLALGRLDAATFLGGAMALDRDAARAAILARAGDPLGFDTDAAAAGILRLTNTNLAAAIRVSLFEKGLDPRDFTMLSFGGAGSVHACAVADELGIRRIIFPVDASTFSARGVLMADIEHAFGRSGVRRFDGSAVAWVRSCFESLKAEGAARLEADGIAPDDRQFELSADLRYRGQAFELSVPWGEISLDDDGIGEIGLRFHAQHAQRFSYASPEDAIELVTLRLAAIGRMARPQISAEQPSHTDSPTAGRRSVYVNGQWQDVATWRRDAIRDSLEIVGPAIVEEDYTAVYVAPGWSLARGRDGHLVAVNNEELA